MQSWQIAHQQADQVLQALERVAMSRQQLWQQDIVRRQHQQRVRSKYAQQHAKQGFQG
jgi:hypothetical protein